MLDWRKRPGQKEAIAALSGRGWKSNSPGNKFFYDYDYYHSLKEQNTCQQVTTYCGTLSEFFKTFKFQFWTSPQNAFPKTHRCEELSRTRTCHGPGGSTPDHFNFDFKHMMWIMNQYLKTPRHVMVWGDQKLIFTSCILFTWCKIWSSRTWKTQTWAKKCPTMALPKLSNQWSW